MSPRPRSGDDRRKRRRPNSHLVMGQSWNKKSRYCDHDEGSSSSGYSSAASSGDEDAVVLLVKGQRFSADKDVLIRKSGYFSSMFGRFVESRCEQVELKEKNVIEPQLFGCVLDRLYGRQSRLPLTPDNVQDLLVLVSYLQIEELQEECYDYMIERIDAENAAAIFDFTLSLGPSRLRAKVFEFLLSKFFHDKVQKSVALSNFEPTHMEHFLSHDRLLVTKDIDVYNCVRNWIDYDYKTRKEFEKTFYKHVNFPLMKRADLKQITNPSLLEDVQEAKDYMKMMPKDQTKYWTMRGGKPRTFPKIFVAMRMYWKSLPMEYFDFSTRQWRTLCPVRNWRSCSALVAFRHFAYLVGGEELDESSPTGSRTVNRVTRYDCENQKWSSAPSMTLARRWAASVVVGERLYVIGGIGGKGGTFERRLDSVEYLELNSGSKAKWQMASPMSTARSSHSVEALDGCIYVVGGGDGKEWLCTSERYDIRRDEWTPISNVKQKRWKCGLAVLNGHLYAIGGMNSPDAGFWGKPLASVERYFPCTDTWEEVAEMKEARFGFAVAAYGGKIYVSGGFGDSKTVLDSTEVYDPDARKCKCKPKKEDCKTCRKGEWSQLPSMKNMCGFVGGVLLDRPLNLDAKDEDQTGRNAIESTSTSCWEFAKTKLN